MDPEQLKKLQAQFDEISNGLASSNSDEVKAAQTRLQALGFPVTPDGQLGKETSAAIGQLRQTISDAQSNIATTSSAEAEQARNDPTNRLVKVGTEAAPYLAGGAIGYGISRKMSGDTTTADADLKKSVSGMSRNPDIRPDVAREELGRLKRNRLMRTVKGTAVPGAFFAGAEATRELIAPQFSDPDTRDIVNSFATGEQAAGITTGVKQLIDLRKGSPIDPEDEAVIKSRARDLTRPIQQPPQSRPLQPVSSTPLPAPRQSLPAPDDVPQEPMRHSDRLKQTVAAAGGKPGKTKSANVAAIKRGLNPDNMPSVAESLSLPRDASRPQILQRLREISRIGGKMVLPLTAGVLAYDAATSDAQAGTGEGTVSDTTRGAIAGGTAAGGAYAMNRLLQAVPKAAPALGALGAGVSAYDYASQAQEAREGMPEGVPSDLIAQATPLAMRGMEGAQAWQDLPQNTREFVARNQSDPTMGMTDEVQAMPQQPSMPMEAVPGERGLLGRRDLNAADLEVPQNLPAAPAGYHQMPDGSMMADSEMQGGEGQPDFDQYIADLQAIFAEMEQGQQPQRRPVQRPMPAPPPAYGGQQNRLLQPTGY